VPLHGVVLERELPERLAHAISARRPGVDPAELIPASLPAVRATIERFIARGFSKFVLVPAEEPASWSEELGEIAEEVLPLQA